MLDDPREDMPDDELDELTDDEAELTEQDVNGRTLSIRRADGEEIVNIQATGDEEWSVHLQPGGAIRNAFIGTRGETPVWLNTWDRQIERDEDGTYVIRID
ncbi:MAG: hypothetical protein ABW137_09285 [Mycobacterium sp.]